VNPDPTRRGKGNDRRQAWNRVTIWGQNADSKASVCRRLIVTVGTLTAHVTGGELGLWHNTVTGGVAPTSSLNVPPKSALRLRCVLEPGIAGRRQRVGAIGHLASVLSRLFRVKPVRGHAGQVEGERRRGWGL
jgi:hypothetical protein